MAVARPSLFGRLLAEVTGRKPATSPADAPAASKSRARRGSETRQTTRPKAVRFTASELEDCAALAAAAGKTVEDYLRDAALAPLTVVRGAAAPVTTRAHTKYLRFKTPEQVAEVKALADRAGLTFGSYVRARALNKPVTLTRPRFKPVEQAELARLLGLVGNGTSNLNQVTARLNSDKEVASAEVRRAAALMQEAALAIIERLGRTPKPPRGWL